MSSDVIIVGGGVIGLSIAFELAATGTKVLLLERGETGQESSWAGAGILPPGNASQAATPEAVLRGASAARWDDWDRTLVEETGLDIGYRHCGGLEVRLTEPGAVDHALEDSPGHLSDPLADEALQWEFEGVSVERLSPSLLRSNYPFLAPDIAAGYFLPTLAQVRNPWYARALKLGCLKRGVEIREGCAVVDWKIGQHRLRGVRLATGEWIDAASFCLTGGAWSGLLADQAGFTLAVRPIRGQIVLLEAPEMPFTCVIQEGRRYLVPRQDGLILVGATEEDRGFEKQNTADAVSGLIRFATRRVPALSKAKFLRAWSGLRPASQDELPYLGAVPGIENLFVAAGHFRAGLQLSPITALLLRQAILGEPTAVALAPYRCDRSPSLRLEDHVESRSQRS